MGTRRWADPPRCEQLPPSTTGAMPTLSVVEVKQRHEHSVGTEKERGRSGATDVLTTERSRARSGHLVERAIPVTCSTAFPAIATITRPSERLRDVELVDRSAPKRWTRNQSDTTPRALAAIQSSTSDRGFRRPSVAGGRVPEAWVGLC